MVIANMKNLLFLTIILIFLTKTGNVSSNNNIFNVNNIEIGKDSYKSNFEYPDCLPAVAPG